MGSTYESTTETTEMEIATVSQKAPQRTPTESQQPKYKQNSTNNKQNRFAVNRVPYI
jgi:hypothetical protein